MSKTKNIKYLQHYLQVIVIFTEENGITQISRPRDLYAKNRYVPFSVVLKDVTIM